VRRLALVAASFLFAISLAWALAEAAYRLSSPPSYAYDSRLAPDNTLGWNSVPPVRALPLNGESGPAVLYLGDSFTQVAQWPNESQRRLAEQGVHCRGFNLGVSGFGTTQEMLKLREHIGPTAPRAVVLLFFAWNDLRDNYPYPEIYYGPQRTSRPYLVMTNGQPTITPVQWASSMESVLLHSEAYLRLFNRAALAFNARIAARWPGLPRQLGWRARLYYEHPTSWHPFYRAADASSPYVQGAYDTTIEAFRQIRAMTDRARASLLVIGIDNSFTVDADDVQDFLTPNPELDSSLPMQRMTGLLQQEGIAFINAQPELAALGKSLGRDVYNGPRGGLAGHLGPEGDLLIGQIAARWLAAELGGR
jgi:hypothetical protein